MQVKLILNEEVIVSASVYYPINRIVNSVWAFMLKRFLYHWIAFSSSFDTQIINNTSKTNF